MQGHPCYDPDKDLVIPSFRWGVCQRAFGLRGGCAALCCAALCRLVWGRWVRSTTTPHPAPPHPLHVRTQPRNPPNPAGRRPRTTPLWPSARSTATGTSCCSSGARWGRAGQRRSATACGRRCTRSRGTGGGRPSTAPASGGRERLRWGGAGRGWRAGEGERGRPWAPQGALGSWGLGAGRSEAGVRQRGTPRGGTQPSCPLQPALQPPCGARNSGALPKPHAAPQPQPQARPRQPAGFRPPRPLRARVTRATTRPCCRGASFASCCLGTGGRRTLRRPCCTAAFPCTSRAGRVSCTRRSARCSSGGFGEGLQGRAGVAGGRGPPPPG